MQPRDYTAPQFRLSALITINTQRDVLDGQPLEIPGTSAAVPNIERSPELFVALHGRSSMSSVSIGPMEATSIRAGAQRSRTGRGSCPSIPRGRSSRRSCFPIQR